MYSSLLLLTQMNRDVQINMECGMSLECVYCSCVHSTKTIYLVTHSLLVYTLSLIDTGDNRETIELVCPDPVFDPESFMYNISVMWNITNPLLSEGVGLYTLSLDRTKIFLPDPSFSQRADLRPEVGTMNTCAVLTDAVYVHLYRPINWSMNMCSSLTLQIKTFVSL